MARVPSLYIVYSDTPVRSGHSYELVSTGPYWVCGYLTGLYLSCFLLSSSSVSPVAHVNNRLPINPFFYFELFEVCLSKVVDFVIKGVLSQTDRTFSLRPRRLIGSPLANISLYTP